MASTNITNIKNAFTLSSTLGGNAGQQISIDPSKISTTEFILLSKTELYDSSSLITTSSNENGITLSTTNTVTTTKGIEPLYYKAGYYSTNSDSNNTPSEMIGNIIKKFLDNAFNKILPTLTENDIESSKLITIKILFGSQESALPNTDQENAGNPPGTRNTPFTPPVTTPGGLANARYTWCESYIKNYIKNLSTNLALTSKAKNTLSKINSDELANALQLQVKKKIVLPFTPYGTLGSLEPGAPADPKFQVPLYFRNGPDNKALWDSNTLSPLMNSQNKSADKLKKELEERFKTEQRSLIYFEGIIDYSKSTKNCNSVASAGNGVVSQSPDFEKLISANGQDNTGISIQGMSYLVPDRFGNLPYFSSTGTYMDRFLWGLILRLVDVTFPGSKAFQGIEYVSSFDATQVDSTTNYPSNAKSSNKTLYNFIKDSIALNNGELLAYISSKNFFSKSTKDNKNILPGIQNLLKWEGNCSGNLVDLLTSGKMCSNSSTPTDKFKKNEDVVAFAELFAVGDQAENTVFNNIANVVYNGLETYSSKEALEKFQNNEPNQKFKEFIEITLGNKIVKVEGYGKELPDETYVYNYRDAILKKNETSKWDLIFSNDNFKDLNEFSLTPNDKNFPIYGVLGSTIFDFKRKCKP